MKDITIVSVLGPEDKSYITRNIDLIKKLNKKDNYIIYISFVLLNVLVTDSAAMTI